MPQPVRERARERCNDERGERSGQQEFEGLLKLFFADGGSLEQLDATVGSVEATAGERLRELAGMAEQALAGDSAYPERRHIAAVALRLQVEQEAAVLRGARGRATR